MALWKIGDSACGHRELPRKIFESYKAAGLDYMEISPPYNGKGAAMIKEVFSEIDFKSLRKYADETGVILWSYHMPFDMEGANLVSHEKEIRDASIASDCEMLKAISEIGMNLAVIHPSVGGYAGEDRLERIKYSIDSLHQINEVAKKCGITLAVENLPRTALCNHSSELLQILESDDTLRVCFDVNHLLIQSHKDFVEAVGDKIVTVHISDYDFVDEKHWLPGKGDINWPELVSLLKGINYQGPFMNEVTAFPDDEVPEGRVSYSELKAANDKILQYI